MLSAIHVSSSLRPSFTWCRLLCMKQRLQFYSKFSKSNSKRQYDSDSSKLKSDSEKPFDTPYPRRPSAYDRRFESPYPRRGSDHDRHFKVKASGSNTYHVSHFEKDKARKSDKQFKSQYQKRNSNYERRFEGDRDRNDFPRQSDEDLYQRKYSGSLLGKKLFRDRKFTEEEIEAEKKLKTVSVSDLTEEDVDDETLFKTLSDSENFGMVGENSAEKIGGMQRKGGRNKKTELPKDWSETFGTLADEDEQKKMEKSSFVENERHWDELEKDREETAHIYNHFPLARYNRRHVPNWYARRIIQLGKQGKVREAIEVFETWMIKQDRVKPTGYEFSVLIKLLADVGYTDKAFELYRMMGKLKIYIEDVIYSSLFNACSNSPYPEEALKLVKTLHTKMLVKGRHPNYITSLALIKAYGMNGDIGNAFRVADEAIELHLRVDLMNNLLVACISDKEAGFRHAVMVWRKFRKLGIQPDLKSYNLLLHAVDVCGIGDPILVNKLLGKSDRQSHVGITDGIKALEAKRSNSEDDIEETIDKLAKKISPRKSSKNVHDIEEIDSLLAKYKITFESSQDVIDDNDNICERKIDEDMEEIPKIECDSKAMKAIEVKVESETKMNKEWWQMDIFENINTDSDSRTVMSGIREEEVNFPNILDPNENFSSVIHVKQIKKPQDRLALIGGVGGILKSIQNDNVKPDVKFYTGLAQSAPQHLGDHIIDVMWARGTKPDIMFYNILLGKRASYDKESAWALYARLRHEEVVPNMKTFTCLSTAAKYPGDGLKVLQDMDDLNLQPNKYILTALINLQKIRFNYMKGILIKMDELGIKPDMHFIKVVEWNIERAKKKIISKERGEIESNEEDINILKNGLQDFIKFYDTWAMKNSVEEKEHPWKHFMEKKRGVARYRKQTYI